VPSAPICIYLVPESTLANLIVPLLKLTVAAEPKLKPHVGCVEFGSKVIVVVALENIIDALAPFATFRVPKDTFNVSMNPTSTYRPATDNRPICSTNHKDVIPGELRKPLFVSGTLKPYITTIGLYDDKSRMLATAKLSTPVQKLDDVDMNFIVRWDY
jgi:hypothetical protein